jgi:hypothetical protein
VPALEAVLAWRVVATPDALDAARWKGDHVDVLRVAPDEALGLGATGVDVDDPDAIVEPEAGFSSASLAPSELQEVVAHAEWQVLEVGADRAVAQGKIAGVPAKLAIGGESVLLVVQTCYVNDLKGRLGW